MKHVVYAELLGSKPLPDGSVMRIAAHGCSVSAVSNSEATLQVIRNAPTVDILVCNDAHAEIFAECRRMHPTAQIILVTDTTMEAYGAKLGGQESVLIDHVIANGLPLSWTIHEFCITIQKIVTGDIFGIEKYLQPGTAINERAVTGSACREHHNREIQKFAEDSKLTSHQAKTAFGICEELLMNAVYDAPVAGGARKHHGTSRTTQINLSPAEQGQMRFGFDGSIFAISVADPFGSFEKSVFLRYLQKVKSREDSNALIDKKVGGAGLGLFKILFGVHSLVCNVEKSSKTEVIALMDTKQALRDFSKMVRSICYFSK